MENNNEIKFEAEDFRGSSGKTGEFSYKQIVLSQVQKCVTNGSKEMKEGFFIYSQNAGQQAQRLRYIGDTREEYFNSLDVLHDLLLAKFDEDMQKQSEEIYTEMEDAKIKAVEQRKETREQAKQVEREFDKTKTKLYRKLFQQLCLFLEREGWLEAEWIED